MDRCSLTCWLTRTRSTRWCFTACAVVAFVCVTGSGCLRRVEMSDADAEPAAAPVALRSITTDSGVEMLLVPGGTFTMGHPDGRDDERPTRQVTLSAFMMDRFEVTQDQLERLQLPNPSHFKGGRLPVEQVRWSDAALLCNERSLAEGLQPCYDEDTFACDFEATGYRLPTEAEWEYAARSGGPAVTVPRTSTQQDLDQVACYSGNSPQQTMAVGSRRPNAFGFFDMLGNVAEWCHDVYAVDAYANGDQQDPRGGEDGTQRVIRGGSWQSAADDCRATARRADDPGISDACFARDTYGFRAVRRPTRRELSAVGQ